MNISNLLNFRGLRPWTSPQGASKTATELSPLALAVQRADQRIQTEVQANTAQLSAFGQLKSSVSDLQLSARALGQLGLTEVPASSAEVQTQVSQLVSDFNASVDSVRTTAALPGDTAAVQSAKRTGAALLDAVSGEPAQALSGLGLTVASGVMAMDPLKLSAALQQDPTAAQASLSSLGKNLDTQLEAELRTQGDIGQAFSQLTQQARTLNAQQSALASAAQATSAYPARSQAGLAAYRAGASAS